MNFEKFKKELIQYEGEEIIYIRTLDNENNENEYTIEVGENFVGGLPDTYEFDMLGHIAYDSLAHISWDTYKYITEILKEKIEEVDII